MYIYYSTTEKNVNPLEKRNINHPHPHLYPNHHAPDVFLSFQFPLLKKKTANAQLCTGKIIAHSNSIENRP